MLAESSAPSGTASAKHFAEIDIAFPLWRRGELGSTFPVGTQLIVFRALLRVAKHFIGFLDFLELVLRLLVVGVQIRMIFSRQLAVGRLDIFFLRIARYAQSFVVITEFYSHAPIIEILV